jgi:Tfp pilus assembly protein FimV
VTVVVEPGDTLWSIAKRLAPGADPRQVVDALVKARGTTALVPGESLTWLD